MSEYKMGGKRVFHTNPIFQFCNNIFIPVCSDLERPIVGESPTFGAKPDNLQKKLTFSLSVDAAFNSSHKLNKDTDIKTANKIKKG